METLKHKIIERRGFLVGSDKKISRMRLGREIVVAGLFLPSLQETKKTEPRKLTKTMKQENLKLMKPVEKVKPREGTILNE